MDLMTRKTTLFLWCFHGNILLSVSVSFVCVYLSEGNVFKMFMRRVKYIYNVCVYKKLFFLCLFGWKHVFWMVFFRLVTQSETLNSAKVFSSVDFVINVVINDFFIIISVDNKIDF